MAEAVTLATNASSSSTASAVDSVATHMHTSFTEILASTGQPWILQLTQRPIIFVIVSVLLGFVLSYGVVYLSRTVVKAFTRRTETDLDDQLLERLTHPAALFLFIASLNIALVPLSLNSGFAAGLNTLLISGNILLVAVIINRTLGVLVNHYGASIATQTESTVDDHILPIVRRMITAAVYTIAVLVILGVWGVEIAPFLAGAGIVGIAIAFSLQETLKNVFGGVSLAFDRAYAVGDRIKLNDGTVGTVLDISLRSTKIRTFDGDQIVVPNGKIANENFQTYAQPTPETRVSVPFSVAYGTDIDLVTKVVGATLKGITHQVIDDKREMVIAVQFIEMGTYSMNWKAIFWVDDYRNSWDAKLEANRRVYDALVKAKIEIPYPVQTVHIKK